MRLHIVQILALQNFKELWISGSGTKLAHKVIAVQNLLTYPNITALRADYKSMIGAYNCDLRASCY